MNWIQLRLSVEKSFVSDFEDLLFENHALSVTCQDAGDNPILEPGVAETPLWDNVVIIALYDGTTETNTIQSSLENHSLWQQVHSSGWEVLEDREWTRAWMDDYHPMKFGRNLWICPSNQEPPEPEAINIFLDPGLAFGTGTHPTTSLCLTWLDEQVKEGQHLIDYGCGSGVLAIAALKLKAKHVLAIDYDPQALVATIDNASRNKIDKSCLTVVLPAEAKPTVADGIVANILAEPLRELVETLALQVKAGGWIALSGILLYQADSLIDLYSEWFNMNEPAVLDEWVLLSGYRK